MAQGGGWRRWLLVATAVAALAGVVIQIPLAVDRSGAFFPTAEGRIFNIFCFFTVQSNLLVAVTSLLLFLRPERHSTTFRILRLAGLVAITVTFLVYHAVLAHLADFTSWERLSDQLIHTVAPLLAIAAWLAYGPRSQIDRRTVGLSLLPGAAWLVFTVVRGEITDFYPYPFIDVNEHGYPVVVLNVALVGVLFYALARAARWLDQRLIPSGAP